MNSSKNQQNSELLLSGMDDWVSFAEVISFIQNSQVNAPKPQIFEEALSLIAHFIGENFWTPGDLSNGQFVGWDLNAEESVLRIRTLLRTHQGEIYPGNICWFCNTEKGDKWAISHGGG